MNGTENSSGFFPTKDKQLLQKQVTAMTNQGFYVWQIARILDITEYEVVVYQGRA